MYNALLNAEYSYMNWNVFITLTDQKNLTIE